MNLDFSITWGLLSVSGVVYAVNFLQSLSIFTFERSFSSTLNPVSSPTSTTVMEASLSELLKLHRWIKTKYKMRHDLIYHQYILTISWTSGWMKCKWVFYPLGFNREQVTFNGAWMWHCMQKDITMLIVINYRGPYGQMHWLKKKFGVTKIFNVSEKKKVSTAHQGSIYLQKKKKQ